MTALHKGLPILAFTDAPAWEGWLAEHADASAGLWLKFAKKGSGAVSVGRAEAIATALAFGWVDGQLDAFDERHWLVRFTPRRPKSKWSQNNRETAEALIAAGRMAPRGLAEVESAQSDGRWAAAYAPQSRAEVPDDLQTALDARPEAATFFSTLRGAQRYAVLYRIHDAKTPKTRAARIEKYVAMLAAGETLHHLS